MKQSAYLIQQRETKRRLVQAAERVTQQLMLDTLQVTLHQEFGFGYDPIKRLLAGEIGPALTGPAAGPPGAHSLWGALPGDPGDHIRPQAGRKGVTHGRALQDRLRQGG